jgi:hypothetical protein
MYAPMIHSLKSTLTQVYKLDEGACAFIADRLSSADASMIEAFIRMSASVCLTPASEKHNAEINPRDALLAAPGTHQLLFENEYVRIIESRIEPGESVPVHTHQWDAIFCILQGTRVRSIDQNGKISEEEWEARVEQFPGDAPDSVLYTYTNIGPQPFLSIAFEIKN